MLALLFIVALTNGHVGPSKTVNDVTHHLQQQLAAHSHVYSDKMWVHDTLWEAFGKCVCVLHLKCRVFKQHKKRDHNSH